MRFIFHSAATTGIDASNLASIFEEHVVVSHLDPFQPINCSFGLKDRVFNFGTLTAQLPELLAGDSAVAASPRDPAGAKKMARPGVSAKRASVAPNTGASADGSPAAPVTPLKPAAAQADTGSLLDDPAAVKANLKFINPKKVSCTVNLSILPQNGQQPGMFFPPCQCGCDDALQQHGIMSLLTNTSLLLYPVLLPAVSTTGINQAQP